MTDLCQSNLVAPGLAERLQQVRLARALALLSSQKQQLVRMIPLLFHVHSPQLPGYHVATKGISTPAGLAHFVPQPVHLEAAKALGLVLPAQITDRVPAPAIEGLYAMGSTGSLGQSPQSDLDIWVIHAPSLSAAELVALAEKLSLLQQWFGQFELQVNFYLVHPWQFRRELDYPGKTSPRLGLEHSGSTQHWLLLDEFYRSQICLGGKPLLWWPNATPEDGGLWLGDIRGLPAAEYFSASLWQLYKGLIEPHKALLKVLLLEAYAWRYPHTELLSGRTWQLTREGDFSADNDAYLLMYQVIEDYLLAIDDPQRLEIARRCFYLKCALRLSRPRPPGDWRYAKLQQLVRSWGWSQTLIQTLDDCESWHSGTLQWFNARLNELMLISYRQLLLFASRHGISECLRVEELGMLTRKLHSYFDEDIHLIPKLNRLWSLRVQEPQLLIVSDQEGGHALYRQASGAGTETHGELLFKAENIPSLLLWACVNQVADADSQWHIQGRPAAGRHLRQAARRLLDTVSTIHHRVSKQDLCEPWHYLQLVLMLNLESQPLRSRTRIAGDTEAEADGPSALVTSGPDAPAAVSVMSYNSWGEWHCHQFCGEQALVKALALVAPGLRRTPLAVAMQCIGYGIESEEWLAQRQVTEAQALLSRVATLSRQNVNATALVQPLRLGGRSYGLFFDALGIGFQELTQMAPAQRLCGALLPMPYEPRLREQQDPFADVSGLIQDFATEDVTQYFLHQGDEQIEVLVLDHHNEISRYAQRGISIEALVNKVSRQYAFDGLNRLASPFNLPQFFQLVQQQGELRAQPVGVAREDLGVEF